MSTVPVSSPRAPDLRWWGLLSIVIALGVVVGWTIAAGVLFLVLVQVARPFDFLTAFLLVVGGASFVEYTGGRLTIQLGILTCGILVMLVCYMVSNRGRILVVPKTPMTWPLLCFVALSIANSIRGFLVGYSPKYLGFELIALLALASAFLVANAFERRRHLLWAVLGLVVVGYVTAIRGFEVFAVSRTHGAGYTMAAPGLVAVLLINLALRSRSSPAAVGLILLAVPMLIQQFVTFGRGLWTGCIAALVASVAIFAGVRFGSGPRWRRTLLVLAVLTAVGLAGALVAAYGFGREDMLRQAGVRFQSSYDTRISFETQSNLIRLAEYLFVWKLIQQSPWFGHGVGYAFTMKQVISMEVGEQWYAHQYYLFVWLKQGIVGLGLFLWLLYVAIAVGVREARRRPDPLESSWFATAAAATIFLAVLSLSNFPFGVVNEMFLLALLWGGAMAMTGSGSVYLRWLDLPARAPDGA